MITALLFYEFSGSRCATSATNTGCREPTCSSGTVRSRPTAAWRSHGGAETRTSRRTGPTPWRPATTATRRWWPRSLRSGVWYQNPNYWRAITRLVAGFQVTHQRHRVPHFAAKPTSSGRTDHDPRRRACLAFACLVCRPLRWGDLGIFCALMAVGQS
jgi:hypothetical protein